MTRELLGRLLRSKGAVTDEDVSRALKLQRSKPGLRIGEALQELKVTDEKAVVEALGEQLNLEVVDPAEMEIPREVLDMVSHEMARKHTLIPVSRDNGRLRIAMADPLDFDALDNIRFATNSDVEQVLATRESINLAISQNLGMEEATVDDMLQEFTESDITFRADQDEEIDLEVEGEDEDAPIIRLVYLLITEAMRQRASDVHVEPMADRLRVRYRVDGVCFEVPGPPKTLQGSIISRIKIMAGIDIAEKRRPTDGRIKFRALGREVDLRVSCLPANHGESVVMRILDKQSLLLGVQELGFAEDDYGRFQQIIHRPNGIFLVTGPTGSGKTTTLYAALNELNTPDRKIITAEDPVEYNIAGINQCEVRRSIGRTFARILRAMLRQAPNIILVGEIRDQETAEIAVRAALTGHLVFSTLHTNDAPSAITRLIDMGVPAFLVASSIQAAMAQRLVRTTCKNCKEPVEYSERELIDAGLEPEEIQDITLYRGAGCDECHGTGYRGRLGIFEMMEMNNELQELAFNRSPTNKIREAAIHSGMKPLRRDGLRKVLRGITTLEEVNRVAAEARQAQY
ncbi:MAG: ATPase, T2SS/T4P/T4SS family [Planctomycetota bacterium]